MIVAIQGDRASFHELAATAYYLAPITYLYCRSFEDVFEALQSGRAERGFVAIANSSHGPIKEVHQLLRRYQPVVEARFRYDVHQHLIGLPDSRPSDIRTVISHPVALSQCSRHLKAYPDVVPYYDTAAAIEQVQRRADPTLAAVGSREAAELYGLTVIEEDIHNDTDNHTVFASFF